MKPIIIPMIDSIVDQRRKLTLPRALSMLEDQNPITNPPKNPSGKTCTLLILSHNREIRNDMIAQPYVWVFILLDLSICLAPQNGQNNASNGMLFPHFIQFFRDKTSHLSIVRYQES